MISLAQSNCKILPWLTFLEYVCEARNVTDHHAHNLTVTQFTLFVLLRNELQQNRSKEIKRLVRIYPAMICNKIQYGGL